MHPYFRRKYRIFRVAESFRTIMDIRLPKLENILPSNLTSLNTNKIIHKCEKLNDLAIYSSWSILAHQQWCGKKRDLGNIIYIYYIQKCLFVII